MLHTGDGRYAAAAGPGAFLSLCEGQRPGGPAGLRRGNPGGHSPSGLGLQMPGWLAFDALSRGSLHGRARPAPEPGKGGKGGDLSYLRPGRAEKGDRRAVRDCPAAELSGDAA